MRQALFGLIGRLMRFDGRLFPVPLSLGRVAASDGFFCGHRHFFQWA